MMKKSKKRYKTGDYRDTLEELSKRFKEEAETEYITKDTKFYDIDLERESVMAKAKKDTKSTMMEVEDIRWDAKEWEGFDIDKVLEEYNEKTSGAKPKQTKPVEKENLIINGIEIDRNNFWIDEYYVEPEKVSVFQYVDSVLKTGGYANILALGEAGTGKTEFSLAMAKFFGRYNEVVDVPTKTEPLMWFGQREIVGGNTVWGKTPLTNFIENGNMFVTFDEINRTKSENLNTLLGLLDFRRETRIMDFSVKAGKGTIFYATANIGYEYAATTRFDKAMFDRFNIYLHFDYMSEDREVEMLQKRGINKDIAEKCVKVINGLREAVKVEGDESSEISFDFSLSPRRTLALATLMQSGLNDKEAVKLSIVNGSHKELWMNVQNIINRVL